MIGSRAREGEGGSEAAAQMQALCTPPSQLLLPPPPPFFGFRSLLIRSGKTPKPFTFMCTQSRDPELRLKLQAPCLLEILGVTPEMNAIVIHLFKIGERVCYEL